MKQFIRELKERDHVTSTFLVSDKSILTDKNGKTYMSFNLKDSSGSINARIWDRVEDWTLKFDAGDFVKIKGFVQVYQNRKQIIVSDIEKTKVDEGHLKDFMGASQLDPLHLMKVLMEMCESVNDSQIRDLLKSTLEDENIRALLLKAPAAKSIHHAYMSGLLEHIVSICQTMNFLSSHYSFLNKDYLIFGAIYHDIGKVIELSIDDGIKYTDRGRLVGHMAIACEMIDDHSARIKDFSPKTKDLLKHIVLSHHGKLEYGSPKEPAMLEAFVVAMIDDLDSKINTIHRFMLGEMSQPGSWSRLNPQFDRYFYLDVLRAKVESSPPE